MCLLYLSITFLIKSKFLRLEHRPPRFDLLPNSFFSPLPLHDKLHHYKTFVVLQMHFILLHPCAFTSDVSTTCNIKLHQANVNFFFKLQFKYLLVFELILDSHFSTGQMSHSGVFVRICIISITFIILWYTCIVTGLSSQRCSEQRIIVNVLFHSSASTS